MVKGEEFRDPPDTSVPRAGLSYDSRVCVDETESIIVNKRFGPVSTRSVEVGHRNPPNSVLMGSY